VFFNDDTNTETEAYSGYLYIQTFNEDRFVAEFRGLGIEQCVEKRSASSQEVLKKCQSVQSQYLPETKVLGEGNRKALIDLQIKTFLNNR
jgi:hypothetical protein